MIDRRLILRSAAAALAAAGLPARSFAEAGLRFGAAVPFSFEGLKDRARAMAGGAHAPPPRPPPEGPPPPRGGGALRAPPAPRAGGAAADRLRRPRAHQFQARPRAVGRGPEPLPGDVLPPRALLPEPGPHARRRAQRGARDPLRPGV